MMPRRLTTGPPRPRLVATFALFPGLVAVMIVVAYVADRFDGRGASSRVVWGCAAALPGLLYYLGVGVIWAGGVDWDARKRIRVALTTAAYVCLFPIVAGLLYVSNAAGYVTTFALLGVSLGGCAVATVVVSWLCSDPRTAETGVPCPKCGYDLRGQCECRCPECGEQFTVGELASRIASGAA